MAELSLRVKKTSSFLKTRHNLEIEAEITGGELPVAAFLEQLCTSSPNVIPELDLQADGTLLEDLRGRPAETFSSGDKPGEEEIFYTDGVLYETDEAEEPVRLSEQLPMTPFTVKIGSRFDSFRGSSHIVHRVTKTVTPVLDEIRPGASLRLLARMFPARLDRIRLALENYRPKSGGSFFGTIPTVRDKVYLDLDRQRLTLRASCEYSGKTARLPFSEWNFVPTLDYALRASGLFPDFAQQLETKL